MRHALALTVFCLAACTGAGLPDSGASVDSGAVGRDASVAANDAGAEALDAGSVVDSGAPPLDAGARELTVTVTRDPTVSPSPIDLTIQLGAAGTASVSVSGPASMSPLADAGLGLFTGRITPTASSGEVSVTVTAAIAGQALSWSRTLLILPFVDAAWGQPELVAGSVNTPGYEDGAEVSPDGQWLLVTDYSPMDMISCIYAGGGPSPSNPACTTPLGPSTAPLRPDLPGAERLSPFLNRCASVCFTSNYQADGGDLTSVVVPPLSAYLFHRQVDGSFAQPQSVAYQADGCAHLMGLSFVSSSATSAEVVFAYDGPWANDGYRVQLATLTLGARNVLGRYACTAPGVATLTASAVSTLTPGGSLGNPNARGGFLWVDDEAAGDLRYWVISGQDGGLSGSSLSAEKNVANPGDTAHRRIMPFFDSATHTLFYSTAAKSIDSRVLTGSDPSSAADWSAAASPVLVADTVSTQGHLFALGEPSIANLPSGARELYFIFVLKTATGVDASVGRVSRSEH